MGCCLALIKVKTEIIGVLKTIVIKPLALFLFY